MKLIQTLVAALLAINLSNVMAEKNNLPTIQSAEHWVQNGDIKIYVWEKFAGSPKNKPVIVLAHGSATA